MSSHCAPRSRAETAQGSPLRNCVRIVCKPPFFLPVRVLAKLFRRVVLEKLVAAHEAGRLTIFGAHSALSAADAFAAYLAPLRRTKWFVYAKRPFAGPAAVLAYLRRGVTFTFFHRSPTRAIILAPAIG